jgi:hypothetical protein
MTGQGWQGAIQDGAMTGKTPDGKTFTLKHVIRKSPTLGEKPPAGAIVLFDGTNTDEWQNGKIVLGKYLDRGTTTKKTFTDFHLHVEFRLPYMPYSRGQGRSNSGVYLQDRYEMQVLDSFGLPEHDNECAAVYSQTAPSLNMNFPPLSWQTYDFDFTAARYQDGKKVTNARVTTRFNGVMVQDNTEIKSQTPGQQGEADSPGPIYLQDHGNPVIFNNIWIVEKK